MKTISLSMLFAMAISTAISQSIFDNPITGTNPNTANPYTAGQSVNANITVSGIGRGSGITGTNTNNRYNATGWNSATFDASDYFEFIITPNSGVAISFISAIFSLQNSASGPLTHWILRSSKDGFTNDIGTFSSNTTGVVNTIDLSAPVFQNITTTITFRIYAWGASSSTGTFSVNDFVFNGITGLLPITLVYFKAAKFDNGNSLQWLANCDGPQLKYFELQRSSDGRNFISIYSTFVTASSCQQQFTFTDNSPLPNKNFYRLLLKEANGISIWSNVMLLINNPNEIMINGLLPSVVINAAYLNITAVKKAQVQIVISDLAGRKLLLKTCYLIVGNNTPLIDFSSLSKGIYLLTIYTDQGLPYTIRFVKQ